jgi:hypothetical protein
MTLDEWSAAAFSAGNYEGCDALTPATDGFGWGGAAELRQRLRWRCADMVGSVMGGEPKCAPAPACRTAVARLAAAKGQRINY